MTTALRIYGLDCADEAAELRAAFQSRAGVSQLLFDVLRGLMFVEHDESLVSRGELISAVAQIGMRAEALPVDHTAVADDGEARRRSRMWLTALSGLLLVAAFETHAVLAG